VAEAPTLRLAAGAAIPWLLLCVAAGAADSYRVVVNSGNPVTSLDRREVSALFLRRSTRWEDGTPVLPVDGPDSPARESFSKDVHGKKAAAVKSHWVQIIFSGRGVPPPQKGSDEEVIAYVKARPGAIGYVSATTATLDVKVLTVRP
jgi:ABC-type phosphate transport system substrate-binding protein